uniref:Uncharacterized protein n=1 Tax=Candidatus Kentrum sp. TC TaxID=2126339 RepID=A0A450YM33_9GAMM|nr:MAG: hypothetical protein BECKTC1821E_GA0114239_102010 [Candidatus Kentron sp. TC]
MDLRTSPPDRPSPFGTRGQPVDNPSGCPPPAHILRPLAHRVHGLTTTDFYILFFGNRLDEESTSVSTIRIRRPQPGIAGTQKVGFSKTACIIMTINGYFAIQKIPSTFCLKFSGQETTGQNQRRRFFRAAFIEIPPEVRKLFRYMTNHARTISRLFRFFGLGS